MIVIRRVRDIGIIALALAVVFALPYACMVHCLLLHQSDHHTAHCTMGDMSAPQSHLDTHMPLVHSIPFIPPALHLGALFGVMVLIVQTLPKHFHIGINPLHGMVLPPHTPPPR